MSLLKRILPRTASGVETPIAGGSGRTDYVQLVDRIVAGDTDAETQLVDRFAPGVSHIIFHIVRNTHLAEDLSQDTFVTIIRKIRNGDLKQPESLGSFVSSVARFHAIEQMRRLRRRAVNEDLDQAEQLPDPSPNRLEELQTAEQLNEIRDLIEQLIPRYRELLWRFYINEEPKDVICADLGLSSMQFDRVLHRARKRYKEIYCKRKRIDEKHGGR